MNSSKSYQLSVDYSALEKRVLALFSQPIESIQSLPRADCKSTLRSMWSQHCYGMGIVERIQDLGRLCAHTISSDSSLRGMRAELLIHDEILLTPETKKMQETNKVTVDVKVPAYESWTIKFPEGANALPLKDSMYSSGDYWCQLPCLSTQGRARVQSNKTRALLNGFYMFSRVLPGYIVALGNFTAAGEDLGGYVGPLGTVDISDTLLYKLFDCAGTCDQAFGLSSRTFYDGPDVVTERVVEAVQYFTGYKVHKQAIELFEEIMLAPTHSLRAKYLRGYSVYDGDSWAATLLMQLHGFVVSRFAIPLGFGFRNGEPVVMLGQPRLHKDYAAVTEYRCVEMRAGKLLANYYGGGVDFRECIEDLKAMNVEPTTYLCKTEREWYYAYENGPRSCMTGYDFEASPVRVYATTSHGLPDNGLRLFIQYTGELFGDDFKVHARAIVNIETNEYVRAYGDAADAILRANGYELDTDCLDGATLARIPHPEHDGAVLMPYLDGNQDGVDELGGDAFCICDCYDYEAQDADGYIWIDDGRSACVECGGRFDEDDMYVACDGGYVCPHCIGDTYVQVVGRSVVYPSWDCSWSDYHDSWVLDRDVEHCAVEGTVHDEEPMVCVQGYNVLSVHAEEHPVHGMILTEYAASVLDEPYLGNEEAEEDKEAKAEQEAA
ncbi:hypothetical protein CPT_Minorna_049 [Escherichia phage Minorna]|uniref:Uncharacterized protein n=1 Tax=Escherichia phage Minorna TaxID=2547246 RepID=A0A482IJY6_9CAUD|nr:hypothetical protein HOV29_gp49 [Escherichia phage Minorna]QBP07100.1 hypothetical protein CPT_Minorna_049 [Escherichia phage Minorna]